MHSFDICSGFLVPPWFTFPAPPLKFRTSGFPQYGFKLAFSRDLRRSGHGLSARTACVMLRSTYTRPKPPSPAPVVPSGHSSGDGHRRRSSPEALGSPAGYVVPRGPRLLWPHPRPSLLPPPYFLRPAGLCPTPWYGLVARASPICSACLSHRATPRTPADRAVASGCCFTPRAGLRHIRTGSASAPYARRFSRRLRNEADRFACAAARWVVGPSPTRTFTFELAPLSVASKRRRISLPGQTAKSRDQTCTGKTRGPMGCERIPQMRADSSLLSRIALTIHFPGRAS